VALRSSQKSSNSKCLRGSEQKLDRLWRWFLVKHSAIRHFALIFMMFAVLGVSRPAESAEDRSFPELFRFASQACREDTAKPNEVVRARYGACQSRNLSVQLVLTKDASAVLGSAGYNRHSKVQLESCVFPLRVTTSQGDMQSQFVGVTTPLAFKSVKGDISEVFVLNVIASRGAQEPRVGETLSSIAPRLLRMTIESINAGLIKLVSADLNRPVDCGERSRIPA
jgi:hypothetical protein